MDKLNATPRASKRLAEAKRLTGALERKSRPEGPLATLAPSTIYRTLLLLYNNEGDVYIKAQGEYKWDHQLDSKKVIIGDG